MNAYAKRIGCGQFGIFVNDILIIRTGSRERAARMVQAINERG